MRSKSFFLIVFMIVQCLGLGLASDANARGKYLTELILRGAMRLGVISPPGPGHPISEKRIEKILAELSKSSDDGDPLSHLKKILGEDYEHRDRLESLIAIPNGRFTDADSVDLYKIFSDALHRDDREPPWPLCGKKGDCLSSPEDFIIQNEANSIRQLKLPPEQFIAAYRRALRGRPMPDQPRKCVPTSLCLSKTFVASFGLDCGKLSIQVSTDGQVSVSFSGIEATMGGGGG